MATVDRYRTPADLPREHSGVSAARLILLPRTTLPLNVFEPRYLRWWTT